MYSTLCRRRPVVGCKVGSAGPGQADRQARSMMDLRPWTVAWAPALALWLLLLGVDVGGEHVVAFASWDPEAGVNVSVVPSALHIPGNYAAKAVYNNSINTTGWGFLEIQTNKAFDDETQAYTAGFTEGLLTADLIYLHWTNTMRDFCTDRQPVCSKIQVYFDENKRWIQEMIGNYSSRSPYWHQVDLFYKQMQGLYAGYNSRIQDPKRRLSLNDFWWLNAQGDLEDLVAAVGGESRMLGKGSCSALVKLLPDHSNLLVGHTTWTGYETMLRLQKKYTTPYRKTKGEPSSVVPGYAMTFSSYPGVIQSGDDYYLLSSGLVTMETTIGNNNDSLWQFVKSRGQVVESVRHMVANRLASSGDEWTSLFSKYNSGTYNNQWMVVDMSRVKKGRSGVLWVLEQLPGMTRRRDRTETLTSQGFWASYNAPSEPDVFAAGGWPALVRRFGDWFTYERTPRALIFRRDQDEARSVDGLLRLLRYNDFRHDPLSRCNCTPPYSAENAVAARNDLNPADGRYPFPALGHRSHGATDAKATDSTLFLQMRFLAESGPTRSSGNPAFDWASSDFRDSVPHHGHPVLWNFRPVLYSWNN